MLASRVWTLWVWALWVMRAAEGLQAHLISAAQRTHQALHPHQGIDQHAGIEVELHRSAPERPLVRELGVDLLLGLALLRGQCHLEIIQLRQQPPPRWRGVIGGGDRHGDTTGGCAFRQLQGSVLPDFRGEGEAAHRKSLSPQGSGGGPVHPAWFGQGWCELAPIRPLFHWARSGMASGQPLSGLS